MVHADDMFSCAHKNVDLISDRIELLILGFLVLLHVGGKGRNCVNQ